MSTVNISLPSEQVNYLDALIQKYGFANRSELIRSLIRLVKYQPTVLSEAAIYPFIQPKTKSISAILTDFKKTKKYSRSFIKDLEEGLQKNPYFK